MDRYDIAVSRGAPRLLVSVVSPDEVEAALVGGADIVDVKNPAEGALGAPTPSVLKAVCARVASAAEVSVALGDAPHLPGTLALAAAAAAACGVDYVKVGLFGSVRPEQAEELLLAVCEAAFVANPRVRVAAVAYADAARVGALPPRELPAIAHRVGAHVVMLDTALKDGRSTFAALGEREVAAFFAEAQALGLMTALAGGLAQDQLARAQALGVDFVGVRGSACDGGRLGRVSASRVRALRQALSVIAPEPLVPGRR